MSMWCHSKPMNCFVTPTTTDLRIELPALCLSAPRHLADLHNQCSLLRSTKQLLLWPFQQLSETLVVHPGTPGSVPRIFSVSRPYHENKTPELTIHISFRMYALMSYQKRTTLTNHICSACSALRQVSRSHGAKACAVRLDLPVPVRLCAMWSRPELHLAGAWYVSQFTSFGI